MIRVEDNFGTRAKKILFLCSILLVSTVSTANSQQTNTSQITLEGQLVCSICWFEADRTTTAYGTPADIECAKDCVEKGIPTAIAVKNGSDFKLYVVEEGQFKSKAAWLDYAGKQVEVVGRTRRNKDKDYIVVDQLRVLSSQGPIEAEAAKAIGSEVELVLKDLFGVEQRLGAYRGKIVVLNFWATWCIPCRKEMPDLAAIQNEYAALGVQVVGASADTIRDRPKVLQFIKETRINFPVWLGSTTADMKQFGLGPGLPGTAIIARDGKILYVKPTVITKSELKKQIDSLLASDSQAITGEIASTRPAQVEASLVPS